MSASHVPFPEDSRSHTAPHGDALLHKRPTTTTIGFVPTVDIDLSQPLDWPNGDGTFTTWPQR